ncbi:unnamed protein product [Durusdinium trenchii]|uniref:Uncharacterized protein n=1 Tax=Durusdinium trenchii TaxID=1381693 RepID=A0ABP0NJ37_9DINO
MLVSPDLMMQLGPPPQEVIDQQWLWKLLMFGFTVVLLLQLFAMDVAGAMLTALLLAFGWVMLKDGMCEMPKYALIYAVLCGLNFFFQILPLFSELNGRVTRRIEVASPPTFVNGTQMTTYTLATQTTSFFDFSQGLAYNAESFSLLLGPLCMGLGTYLAAFAHNEMQRYLPMSMESWDDPPLAVPMPTAPETRPQPSLRVTREGARESSPVGRDTYMNFSGQSHKLDGG